MPGPIDRPTSPAERKAALRAELRAIRRAIAADAPERRARSARIWAGIVAVAELDGPPLDGDAMPAQVLLFESLPTEPDTAAWFAWCAGHGVACFRPEVDGPDLRVLPGDIDPASLDVVVVPGLGFTRDGWRLGQGGGHYDRFLGRVRPDCLTIGACFAEQVLAGLPIEPHDARVRVVVTDAAPTR